MTIDHDNKEDTTIYCVFLIIIRLLLSISINKYNKGNNIVKV
jgi:hypothetical protein